MKLVINLFSLTWRHAILVSPVEYCVPSGIMADRSWLDPMWLELLFVKQYWGRGNAGRKRTDLMVV